MGSCVEEIVWVGGRNVVAEESEAASRSGTVVGGGLVREGE